MCLGCQEIIVKLSLNANVLKPISRTFACFGNDASRRCFLLGMPVPNTVRLSFKSSSNKDTLAKYQSNLMLRFDLFKSSTSFLTTWTPRFNGGALPSLPRYGMAL